MIAENKLLKAVLKRSVPQVQDCIIEGEDIFFKDEHGRTYLHLSVYLRCGELVKYFLQNGLGVADCDKDKVTALHRACRIGCDSIVEHLLLYGACPKSPATQSRTPLHVAAAFGHGRCMSLLLEHSSITDPDLKDDNNHTPLHYAAAEGHLSTATILLKHGSHANATNVAGNRPLHFAATSEVPELCQILVQHNADIDAQNFNGQTALHLAIQQACENTVMALLNLGADPNLRDINGNSCSHLAIKNGHIDLVKILMMYPRTNPSISDNDLNSVLHVALKLGHFNLLPMMLPKASDLTIQDASGCSIIIEAIKNQLEDLALEMLMYCPSLVHTATHDLVTPLHLAAERGMTDLTKQLLIAGAQVNAEDSGGLTPSLYCAKNDQVLECLSMIEDVMKSDLNDQHQQQQQSQHVKGNSTKISSRISS